MRPKKKMAAVWGLVCGLAGLVSVVAVEDPQTAARNVLCLHSYHKAAWTDALNRGYDSVLLARSDVTMLYEYMDTKKAHTPEYLRLLKTLYQTKFRGMEFDLILTSDDNALRFALAHQSALFGDAPIVFCGVNNYHPELLPANGLVTGVVEEGDFRDTMEIAMRVRPGAKTVFTICDSTATSKLNLREFRSVLQERYPQLELETSLDMTVDELRQTLSSMRPDNFAFFIAFWRDAAGTSVSPETLGELFRECPAPVFGRSEWMIGRGMCGGKCVSGFHQGEAAAQMAATILDGTRPDAIPVNTSSPNKFMFDYGEMLRHGITASDLPEGSIINGRPKSGIHLSVRRMAEIGVILLLLVLLATTLLVLLVVRHRSAQRLAESERNYREIFNATDEAIFIHDMPSGRVLDVNRTMLDMYGFSREEVLSLSPDELSEGRPPYSSREAQERIQRALDATQVFEWRARHKDGSLFWVEISLRRSSVAGKDRVIAVVRDIGERKSAERREAEAKERLARWERMESLGALAGGVAHDLNNILGPLVALPELLMEDLGAVSAGDEDALQRLRSDLTELADGARRAAGTIRDLMAIGRRADTGREPVAVAPLLTAFLDSKEAQHLRKNHPQVALELEPSGGLPAVLGSASHIHRIVGNLVRNAFDAMPTDGGRVTVSARCTSLANRYAGHEIVPAGEYVVISVRDTGQGIPEEFLGRIFEPFFSKKMQTPVSGTGLGLAIVRSLTKGLDGYVDCRNDRGAVFEIFLPVTHEEAASDQGASPIQKGSEKVLVVDDEPAQANLARRILQELGYTVSVVTTGTLALERIARLDRNDDSVDLVVLDAVMPADISGIETLRRIRASHPNLAVVMVSGYASETDMAVAHRLGAGWLAKPYLPEQLAMSVRNALDTIVQDREFFSGINI